MNALKDKIIIVVYEDRFFMQHHYHYINMAINSDYINVSTCIKMRNSRDNLVDDCAHARASSVFSSKDNRTVIIGPFIREKIRRVLSKT